MHNDIIILIPKGKENAIHLTALARELKADQRTIKRKIKELRRAGYPILSSARGYWIGTQEETEIFFKSIKKSALCRLKTISDMKKNTMNYYKGEK